MKWNSYIGAISINRLQNVDVERLASCALISLVIELAWGNGEYWFHVIPKSLVRLFKACLRSVENDWNDKLSWKF